MKKILIVLMLVLLTSCNTYEEDETYSRYESVYRSIIENDKFQSYSLNYEISGEVVENSEGMNYFYIFIDKPNIAMYDISAMAIEKDVEYNSNHMAASVGVIEDENYSMIPFQYNKDQGFYKGIMLSGTSENTEINIDMVVIWHSLDLKNINKEFINFTINKDGIVELHEEIGN